MLQVCLADDVSLLTGSEAYVSVPEELPRVNLKKYQGSIFDYIQLSERSEISTYSTDNEKVSAFGEPTGHSVVSVRCNEEDENNADISLFAISGNDYDAVFHASSRNRVSHPKFAEREEGLSVSPFDGNLQLNYTEISLPGRNGLDLELGHFFQNEHCHEEILYRDGQYGMAPVTYFNKRYALGLGWSFSFPSVELRKKQDGEYQAYYHDGKGNTYRSNYKDSTKNEEGEDYYNGYMIYSSNLDNYYTDNVRFREEHRSYIRDNIRSQYSFKRTDNTMEYFAEDGRLISIMDRFGNEIKFDYLDYPAENIIPFYSCLEYDLGTGWTTTEDVLTYDGSSVATSSASATQYVELDEMCDKYYVSLLYQATGGMAKYEGSFEVYCDLYSENYGRLESVLIEEVTPDVHDQAFQITGSIDFDDYDLDETPANARIRIKVKNSKNDIHFTDVRFSPYRPLMSKITDTVGRTIDFQYEGDLYDRYETATSYPITATVKDPNGELIREIKYFRDVRTAKLDYNDEYKQQHFHFFLRTWTDGESYYALDYDYMAGSGSHTSTRISIVPPYMSYDFTARPVICRAPFRNSWTKLEYEKTQKWVDNRPKGSNDVATVYNTCFYDTWRVIKHSDMQEDTAYDENLAYNTYTYNYTSGFYTDDTAFNRITSKSLDIEPGYLNPEGGEYIVIITNPNESIEKYEYTTHVFDEGFRLKWSIKLPLLDRKTVYESSESNCDAVVQEYAYEDNIALVSPTEIKTTEIVNGVAREYYNKIEYDQESCLPILETLPLTVDELYDIPEEKTIVTEYKNLSNRMFLPETVTYYQSMGSKPLTDREIYDDLGRVISTCDAKGNSVNYEYSDKYIWMPSKIYFTDPENLGDTERMVETLYYYNDEYGFGPTSERIKFLEDSTSYSVTSYQYEPAFGNISKKIVPNNSVIRYEYDNMGRIVAEYHPPYTGIGNTNFYVFKKYRYTDVFCDDRKVYQISETIYSTPDSSYAMTGNEDEYSTMSTYCYDDYGNLHESYVLGENCEYIYDKAGRIVGYKNGEHIGKSRNTLTYTYDGFNRVTSVADYMGNTQNALYNTLSVQYSFMPVDGEISENHCVINYDIYGNKISESIYPDGIAAQPLTTYYEYDLLGNVTKITDAKNQVLSTEYDVLNNPVAITKPDGNRISYDYTKWNTIKSITQYDENQPYSIHETFDNRGLSLSHRQIGVGIDTKPWYYSHDAMGLLFFAQAPNGVTYSHLYDSSGNNTYSEMGSIAETKTYNLFGLVNSVNTIENGNEDSWIDYEYNDYQRLPIRKTDDSGTVCYSYNSLNSIIWMEYGYEELRVNYSRDDLNRVSTVNTSDDKQFNYEYYADGLIKSVTYPSGNIVANYIYDNANRLINMETVKGNDVLVTYSYTYDELGNILSVSGSQNASYTYDELNRLKTVTEHGYTATYEYDNLNNLVKETRDNGYIKTYEYSGDNRLYKTVENGVETIYEYDLNGNLIKRGNDVFAYDSKDRLVYTNIDGAETEYEIGVDGLRWRKKTDAQITNYLYDDAGNLLCEDDDTYVVCDNRVIAKKIGNVYYYYVYNAHGDVVMLVDETGNIKNTYQYDAWGSIVAQNESIKNNHKYAGEYLDNDSGLVYLRARYYEPSIGRFISEDPARDDLNWYVYAKNNPVNAIDPSGLRTYFINGINNSKEEGSPQYSIDFANKLTKKGVEDVRTIGVYNGTGTITGVGQVAMEMVNKGKYAENVANKILEDLENDPLADGEELNLIGYSGGGQIVLNVCELLQGKATVDNSVLIGTPVSELTLNNTGKTTMIYAGFDPLSWNVSWYPISLEFAGWIGHTSYFNKDNIGKVADLVNKHID